MGRVKEENPYADYPGRPQIIGSAAELIEAGRLRWEGDGSAVVSTEGGDLRVAADDQMNIVGQTFDALQGNLQPGTDHESGVNAEVEAYNKAELRDPAKPAYGEVVYYPNLRKLVWMAPKWVRGMAQLSRNEFLLRDPQMRLTYDQQRQIFGSMAIGLVGASVNFNLLRRLEATLKPARLKVADRDEFDDATTNRTNPGLMGLGGNKAVVAARQVHEIFPWRDISVYPGGVDTQNIGDFIGGNQAIGEPRLSVLAEAADDVEMKVIVAGGARRGGVDLWRMTDLGAGRQVEYLPYSRYARFPLAVGTSDRRLKQALQRAKDAPSRETWFDFAFALVGPHWREVPEFAAFIDGKIESPYGTAIPQLGIAAEAAASDAALGIASVALGWSWPNRYFVEPRRGVQIWEWVRHWRGELVRQKVVMAEGRMSREVIDLKSGRVKRREEIVLPAFNRS